MHLFSYVLQIFYALTRTIFPVDPRQTNTYTSCIHVLICVRLFRELSRVHSKIVRVRAFVLASYNVLCVYVMHAPSIVTIVYRCHRICPFYFVSIRTRNYGRTSRTRFLFKLVSRLFFFDSRLVAFFHSSNTHRFFFVCCLSISVLVVVLFTVHCKMDSSPIVTTHTNNKSKSSRKSLISPNKTTGEKRTETHTLSFSLSRKSIRSFDRQKCDTFTLEHETRCPFSTFLFLFYSSLLRSLRCYVLK